MEEVFENKVLDDLYETRKDGFEAIYVKMYGEKGSLEKTRKAEEFFKKLIENIVDDEKIRSIIWKSFCDFQDSMIQEMLFWDKQYYKLGFLDKKYLQKELKDKRKEIFNYKELKSNYSKAENEFLNQYDNSIEELIRRDIYLIAKNDKEYSEKIQRIRDLKKEYPNLIMLLENNNYVQLTKKETDALLEYIDLNDDLDTLEKIIAFKLGLKEGSIF